MARVKRGVTTHARHKKIIDMAAGFRGRSSTNYRIALERVEKALKYAYRDRRNRKRVFRAPLWWLVGGITILGCVVFFFSLKTSTQLWFLAWNVLGLVIYFAWSSRNSRLAKGEEVEG